MEGEVTDLMLLEFGHLDSVHWHPTGRYVVYSERPEIFAAIFLT